MGSHAESDPRPGGSYAVDINAQARARGRYVEVMPHTRIVFTSGWEGDDSVPPGSSTVEVTLTPDGDGTHLRLVHRGLLTAAMREQHRDGWQLYLGRLSVAAGGGEPGPDPNAALTPGSPQQIGPRGVKQVIVVQVQPIDQGERSGRTVHFADRHGAMECHYRRGRAISGRLCMLASPSTGVPDPWKAISTG